MDFAAWKDRENVAQALRAVYRAADQDRPGGRRMKMGRQPVCHRPKCLRRNEAHRGGGRGLVVRRHAERGGDQRWPDVDFVGRRRPPETPNQFPNTDPGLAGETGVSGVVGTVYPLDGLKTGGGGGGGAFTNCACACVIKTQATITTANPPTKD